MKAGFVLTQVEGGGQCFGEALVGLDGWVRVALAGFQIA
jgi:hypothetical protein